METLKYSKSVIPAKAPRRKYPWDAGIRPKEVQSQKNQRTGPRRSPGWRPEGSPPGGRI